MNDQTGNQLPNLQAKQKNEKNESPFIEIVSKKGTNQRRITLIKILNYEGTNLTKPMAVVSSNEDGMNAKTNNEKLNAKIEEQRKFVATKDKKKGTLLRHHEDWYLEC